MLSMFDDDAMGAPAVGLDTLPTEIWQERAGVLPSRRAAPTSQTTRHPPHCSEAGRRGEVVARPQPEEPKDRLRGTFLSPTTVSKQDLVVRAERRAVALPTHLRSPVGRVRPLRHSEWEREQQRQRMDKRFMRRHRLALGRDVCRPVRFFDKVAPEGPRICSEARAREQSAARPEPAEEPRGRCRTEAR